ncbi:unnamed protein product [Arabidopsis arenosa]|uniref:Ubiquitin-like protease family profile domain-containing protein n=1 Tax=Arabidopsis arenosa TaxID=38785 RepID=A0A8S2A898_ARAAE|nr:unnamed protein product [Arabidopsis arenosa]
MENNLGSTTTAKEFPKRLFGHGKEPEVEKINNKRNVEMFVYIIPRIVKDVHGKVYGKVPLLTQYEIINVKVPKYLNTSMCDCGVYALKHIECHMLNLSMDLINDGNIKEARMKIVVDLWEAAHDPILIERMKNYKPPHQSSDILEID